MTVGFDMRSPGLSGWEWIETTGISYTHATRLVLLAFLVGSGLKPFEDVKGRPLKTFSWPFWLGVD